MNSDLSSKLMDLTARDQHVANKITMIKHQTTNEIDTYNKEISIIRAYNEGVAS